MPDMPRGKGQLYLKITSVVDDGVLLLAMLTWYKEEVTGYAWSYRIAVVNNKIARLAS